MKFLTLIIALAFAVPGQAQLAAPASLSFSVKEMGSKRGIQHNWESGYGSYDRDYIRSRSYAISIRNLSSLPAEFSGTFYFIGKHQVGGNTRRVILEKKTLSFDASSRFPASDERVFEVTSSEIGSNTTHYSSLRQRYHSGYKFDGWILSVRAEGAIAHLSASSEDLKRLAQNREAAAEMIKDYEQNHSSRAVSSDGIKQIGR